MKQRIVPEKFLLISISLNIKLILVIYNVDGSSRPDINTKISRSSTLNKTQGYLN